MSSWRSARPGFDLSCLNYMRSFPVWSLGQDAEFDCIGSRSLPFHLQLLEFSRGIEVA